MNELSQEVKIRKNYTEYILKKWVGVLSLSTI